MIKSLWIDNFKSLVDFDLDLAKLSCLVGLNGAGKSTVLQAMDFLSQLMVGDLDDWLQQRQWDSADINSKLTKKSNIDFKLVVDLAEFGEVVWSGSINRKTLRCSQERVEDKHRVLLRVDGNECLLREPMNFRKGAVFTEKFSIVFEYQGSILSSLKDKQTNALLQALKTAILDIRSLDLLSPELLRSRAKTSQGKLGLGGQRLSAFIHESGDEGREQLKQALKCVYQQLESVDTRSLRSGWKQLEITEKFEGHILKSSARHINDGMLRLMAILTQLSDGNAFLLFDEIENGINAELIEFLIDHLVATKHQVLVTTHSPMILNFLEDSVAVESVIYLYKNSQGFTRSIKFFNIPSMAEKLKFMGVGEVFIDTDLTQLYQEIELL